MIMTMVALIQESPVYLDKNKTMTKAAKLVHEASSKSAKLILFPEAFIPGYPAWIWRLRPGGDWGLCEDLHSRLLKNSVDLSTDELRPLLDAAKETQTTIVCGLNERDAKASRSTIYNAVVTISHEGKIINHHRKLMPTNPERMTWGFGDASGLKVIDTPAGKAGSLICWENYMPLARYALYSQGIEVYLAPTYDSGETWISSMRHIAKEGGCWVLCCGVAIHRDDIPADFPDRDRLYPDNEEWINPGDSVVVAPGGEIVAGPMHQEKGMLLFDIDLDKAARSKRALDVAGHYARPDIFTLHVDTKPQTSAEFELNH
jgi:nitrilase